MKPKSLLVLTLLVAGLGAFVWFGRELPSTAEREERAKRVLQVEPEDVRSLEIERDGKVVVLSRQVEEEEVEDAGGESGASEPAEWRLEQPIEARADATAADGLVRRLVTMEKERTLEDVERADVGLAEPRARVRIGTGEGERVLEVGAEVPASSTMTLAVEGESPVYIVGSSVWSELAKEPGDWRDKNLFSGERGDIERINIERGGDRLVLAKRGDDFWLESPLADRADPTHVNSLLSAITGLRAERFVDAEAGEAGSGPDQVVATLEVVLAGRPEPLRLAVGPPEQPEETDGSEATAADPAGDPAAAAPVETLYLGVDGQLVTTRAALTEHAERPVEDWRSKDLVAGEVYELARVEIEDAEGSTELRRVDSEWLRDGEPIDYGVATDLLYEISGGRAERVVTAASVEAAGEPVLTVRLIPEAGDGGGEVEPEVLRLYAARDGETPARVTDRDAVLVLSAETAGGIREKLAAVRSAPVEEPPEEEGSETDGEAGGGPDGTERESGGGGGTG